MKAAGWQRGNDGIWAKNGRRFSVEVTYGSERHTPKLVVLKEEAKRAGVELKLQKLDPSAWYKKISEDRHEVIIMGFGTGLRPSFWQTWHSDNAHKPQTNNVTNTDDPELDRMIDRYRNSLDEDERIHLSLQIQEKIHEIGAFVPEAMRPYFRQAYWRWWRLPHPPATKHSSSAFSPFDSMTGGLFWYDKSIYDATKKAMKRKKPLKPTTIIDQTYKIP
jgi:microcin C transport system substrate-binding protein